MTANNGTGATMRLRPMNAKTAASAAALEAALFAHPWREADFLASLQDPARLFLTAEEQGDLLGYCGLQWAAEQGDVLTIGTRPDARRRGIGEALLRYALAEMKARSVFTLFLEVRESNFPARALYEKLGFTLCGRRKGYYQDPPEDGLVYRREETV